jgi:hypothetical protein
MNLAANPKVASLSEDETIPPEVLAAIVAAATAFLGANFRIRSLERLDSHQSATSRWTHIGRASVQASHNVRSERLGVGDLRQRKDAKR